MTSFLIKDQIMNRKNFLLQAVTGTGAILLHPVSSIAKGNEEPEPYKLELVKEFVIAGHGNLSKIK